MKLKQELGERTALVVAYLDQARKILTEIEADYRGKTLSFAEVVYAVIGSLVEIPKNKKLIFIGNGGSAAIASEVANRFWKFCKISSLTFNDPVILSSTANDYGWENVFAKPIEVKTHEKDILFAISSSGQSENIIRGIGAARSRRCGVITLTGFSPDNPVRKLGDVNFYVPSNSYRHVERTHLLILDCIHDIFLLRNQSNQ